MMHSGNIPTIDKSGFYLVFVHQDLSESTPRLQASVPNVVDTQLFFQDLAAIIKHN